MKIIRLEISNFKRLSAVSINPDGTLCQITGRNGQGKTSTLDAIESALIGVKSYPARPIRNGAANASVVIETEDLRVTRRWTQKSDSLVVESKDGAVYRSPQAMLDKLIGNLSFDPLAFTRMRPLEQAETLRTVVGVDTRGHDAERAAVYAERTGVNADIRRLQAQIDGIPQSPPPMEVGEEIDIAELANQKAKALDANRENDLKRSSLRAALQTKAEAEAKLEWTRARLAECEQALAGATSRAEEKQTRAAGLQDADTSEIDARLATAKTHNLEVRRRQKQAEEHARAKAVADSLRDQAKAKAAEQAAATKRLEEIDAAKTQLLASAKFPIAGMTVDGDQVSVNGVPLSQASSSEQIKIGLAMGAALNPKLRVVLVRDGSLLDEDSMRIVAKFAEENDLQVIMERVAQAGGPVGVIIENGMVANELLDPPEAILS